MIIKMRIKPSAIIVTLMLALSAFPAAQAYDIHVASGFYNFSGPSQRSVYLTYASLQDNLDAYSGDVVIPATITYNGKEIPVKGVGDHALFNCQRVTSVTLPEGVTYILDQAFSHCYAMQSLSLPSTLEMVNDYAFEFCDDLTTVTIPAKVSEFGYAVFSNCLGLTEIKVEEGNSVLKDVDGVLYTADGSTLVQYPAGLTATAFSIPDEVSVVTDYAFSPAPHLHKVAMGAAVREINPLTFADCTALTSVTVDAGNPFMSDIDGVLFDKDATKIITYPACRATAEYVLTETVTTVGDMAFANASRLRDLTLPEGVASIGAYAFIGSAPATITVKAHKPPLTDLAPFDTRVYTTATLYVHADDIAAYQRNSVWGQFKSILSIEQAGLGSVGDNTSTVRIIGDTVIAADGIPVTAYLPDGRLAASGIGCVTLPSPGMYIVTLGATSIKVAL